MSSPIGHSLAGLAIFSVQRKSYNPLALNEILACIFIANLPDIDFLAGVIIGMPNMYHHGVSHSLGAAVIFSTCLACLFRLKQKRNRLRNFWLYWGLYMSHVILDLFSYDSRLPAGIPLLWPFTDSYFILPILPPIKHSSLDHATIGQVLSDILSVYNLYTILIECLLASGLYAIFIVSKRFFHNPRTRS